jgi:ADP-ribose pyrophosphatase YjhB (NUDIX family)
MPKSELHPIPAVGALIFYNDNILLVKNLKCTKFTLPGGRVKRGEKLLSAVKREVKEETNLPIKKIKLIIIHENIFSNEYYKKEHFISFEYLCQTTTKDVKLNNELKSHLWVNIKKSLSLHLDNFTRITIKTYLKRFNK